MHDFINSIAALPSFCRRAVLKALARTALRTSEALTRVAERLADLGLWAAERTKWNRNKRK